VSRDFSPLLEIILRYRVKDVIALLEVRQSIPLNFGPHINPELLSLLFPLPVLADLAGITDIPESFDKGFADTDFLFPYLFKGPGREVGDKRDIGVNDRYFLFMDPVFCPYKVMAVTAQVRFIPFPHNLVNAAAHCSPLSPFPAKKVVFYALIVVIGRGMIVDKIKLNESVIVPVIPLYKFFEGYALQVKKFIGVNRNLPLMPVVERHICHLFKHFALSIGRGRIIERGVSDILMAGHKTLYKRSGGLCGPVEHDIEVPDTDIIVI